MEIEIAAVRDHYERFLSSLAGVEDDMIANYCPMEAVELLRDALIICQNDFKQKYEAA